MLTSITIFLCTSIHGSHHFMSEKYAHSYLNYFIAQANMLVFQKWLCLVGLCHGKLLAHNS